MIKIKIAPSFTLGNLILFCTHVGYQQTVWKPSSPGHPSILMAFEKRIYQKIKEIKNPSCAVVFRIWFSCLKTVSRCRFKIICILDGPVWFIEFFVGFYFYELLTNGHFVEVNFRTFVYIKKKTGFCWHSIFSICLIFRKEVIWLQKQEITNRGKPSIWFRNGW